MNLLSLSLTTLEHLLKQEVSVEVVGQSSEAGAEVVVTNEVDAGTSRILVWVGVVDSRHTYMTNEEGHEEDEETVALVAGRITTSLSATETLR